MNGSSSRRDAGAALFLALVVLMAGLALSGAMVSFALADSRGMRRNQDCASAFYLAESGLQGAHCELGEHLDSQNNGEGTRTRTVSGGSYSVAAVDLGSDLYRLTSTGLFGGERAVIEEVVEIRPTS